MKVGVITPIIKAESLRSAIQDLVGISRPDCVVREISLHVGPASIESYYEEALAAPDTVIKARQAAEAGCDALLINCMGDPGLEAAREVVQIPVLGAALASMHLAVMLAHRFSIIVILERNISVAKELARAYGVDNQLASVRAVNIPVLDLEADRSRVVEEVTKQAILAVTEDDAHLILLGCTGMTGLARAVQSALCQEGFEIPVLDPAMAALKICEALVDLDLSHSKRTYPYPPEKLVLGYPGA